jgi:hypothetical protein
MLSPDIREVQLGARAIDVSAGPVNVSVRVRVTDSAGTGQTASGVTAVNVFVGSAGRQQVDTHPPQIAGEGTAFVHVLRRRTPRGCLALTAGAPSGPGVGQHTPKGRSGPSTLCGAPRPVLRTTPWGPVARVPNVEQAGSSNRAAGP